MNSLKYFLLTLELTEGPWRESDSGERVLADGHCAGRVRRVLEAALPWPAWHAGGCFTLYVRLNRYTGRARHLTV